MTCDLCGSGIPADEKVETQQKGNIRRYAYYGRTKSRDKSCPCGYVKEEELIRQSVEIIGQVSIDRAATKEKLSTEIERFQRFQGVVLRQEARSPTLNLTCAFTLATSSRLGAFWKKENCWDA